MIECNQLCNQLPIKILKFKEIRMETIEKIRNAVIFGKREEIKNIINDALSNKIDPLIILNDGLVTGIKTVGEKFQKMELYLPDMILAADTMKIASNELLPYIDIADQKKLKKSEIIVIGTVKGDVHDIGKNVVKTFLEVSGFLIHDIGINAPSEKFIEKAEEVGADIIGLSALMTTTMNFMKDVIDELNDRNLRDKYKVIIGGPAVTREFSDSIGADGFGNNFAEAVKIINELTKRSKD